MVKAALATEKEYQKYRSVIPKDFLDYYDYSSIIIMHLIENDKLIGIGAMEVFDGYSVIKDIFFYNEDISLKELLLKSMLNFLFLHDIENVYSNNKKMQDFLLQMQFCFNASSDTAKSKFNENTVYLNLNTYFRSNCGNCTQKK